MPIIPTRQTVNAVPPAPRGAPTSTFVSRGKTVNSYDTPLPTRGVPSSIVPAGYNINNDPTYSGGQNADSGFTGTPTTAGNVGPSAGQSWEGGQARWDGSMAGGSNVERFKSVAQRAKEAGDAADAELVRGNYLDPAQRLAARQQAEKNAYDQAKLEQEQQNQQRQQSNNSALSSAAGNQPLGAYSLGNRLTNMTGDRQAYVTKRRAEGISDQQIRTELASGAAMPTTGAAPVDAGSTEAPTVTTPTPAPTGTPTATTGTPTATSTKTPEKGGTPAPAIPFTKDQQSMVGSLQAIMNDPKQDSESKLTAAAIISQIQSDNENMNLLAQGAAAQGGMFDTQRDDITATTEKVASQLNKSYAMVDSAAQSIRDLNEKSVQQAQQAQAQRLTWEADKATRQLSENQRKMYDESVASLAVTGRMGSSGALQVLNGVTHEYEQQLSDLQHEVGVQKTELSAKFTALHSQVNQDYFTAVSGNIKDLTSSLQTLALQGLSGRQSIATAENNALQTFVTNTVNARQSAANGLREGAKEMSSIVNQKRELDIAERKDKRNFEWDQSKFEFTSNLALMKEQNDLMQSQAAAGDRALAAGDRQDAKSLTTMNTVTNGLNSRINNDPIIKEALLIRPKYNTVKNVYAAAVEQQKLYDTRKIDKKGMNFTDQVLISNFNKLTDPSSVVRESEYARSSAGLSLIESVRAKFQSISAGGVLTPAARKELFDVATTLNDSYTEMFNQKSQQYYLQLGQYNSNVSPQYQMTPEQFGLPSTRNDNQQNFNLEGMAPEGLFPQGNPFEDNPPTTDSSGYQSFNFGDKKVTASPVMISALARANQAFFADTGKHLDVNSSLRSNSQQKDAYAKYQRGEIALAAKPGTSFHEKGMAVDVTNWKEAEQYLIAAGIYPLPKHLRKNDPAHFSIGESPTS